MTTAAGVTMLLALGAGALASVLAVVPYRSFDLDRFFAPKELALHVAALVAGVAALASTRRLVLSRADLALCLWLLLSAVAAIFATNHGLAYRALMISISGAAVFWSARAAASAGFGRALVRVLALVVVIGAITALAQAYGVKMEFAALNRAPGGMFGNRNPSWQHLTAAGIPPVSSGASPARAAGAGRSFGQRHSRYAPPRSFSRAPVLRGSRSPVSAVLAGLIIFVRPSARGKTSVPDPAENLPTRLGRRPLLAWCWRSSLPNTLDWRPATAPYLDSVRGVVDFHAGSGRGRVAQYANSGANGGIASAVWRLGRGTGP